MAITQCMVSSFKQEILTGVHNLASDTLKIALYTSSATLDATTTAYSTSNEVTGPGYTAGGITLSGQLISLIGTTAIVDFDDAVFVSSTLTARAALIYNASKANRAIAVLDFGVDKSTVGDNFKINFPPPAALTAVVRVGAAA